MDRYRKVEKPKAETPINENDLIEKYATGVSIAVKRAMASLSTASASLVRAPTQLPCFRLNHGKVQSLSRYSKTKSTHLSINSGVGVCSVSASQSPVSTSMYEVSKKVWIWTENSQVMTAAVERGWNTFLFSSENQGLASVWSTIALIDPLFIKEGEIVNNTGERVATIFQVVPAENIVPEFQGSRTTVLPSQNHLLKHNYFWRLWSTGSVGWF